jgi:3-carboxy-cis,cis-muconate cycloisomerase
VISFAQTYMFNPKAREIWSDGTTLQRWLDVEAALARAQADLGMIPTEAARRIASCARADAFDLGRLSKAIAVAQHPLVPVLKEFVAMCGEPAGGWIHWGATTQNIFDTAQSLQLRESADLIEADLRATIVQLRARAREHARTLQAGRTHGQHALPITFGFKLVYWLSELERHRSRLAQLRDTAFVVRMGGAVGTYAAMRGRGREVEARIAKYFELPCPDIGGRSDCDRQAEFVAFLGMLAATCEKVAGDLFFMQRTEIAEIEENHYAGRAGSSTMAQKRNPQEAQRVLMLARMTRSRVPLAMESMVRAEEGDAVPAHIMDYVLPETAIFASSTVQALCGLLTNMKVRAGAMARNFRVSGGLIMAEAVMMKLATAIGRDQAHHLVHAAASECAETGAGFPDSVRRHADRCGIDPRDIADDLFDPMNYLGEIEAIIAERAGTA